jgi:hypothetical protein
MNASNRPVKVNVPAAGFLGTRTEAEQNVPQAKPEIAELRVSPDSDFS